jgi:endonuclease III
MTGRENPTREASDRLVSRAVVTKWRRSAIETIRNDRKQYPGAAGLDAQAIQDRLNKSTVRLRKIARVLSTVHGNPRLGNLTEPVDELVYIILSRKTRESAYQLAFKVLKKRFSTWDALLRARPHTVERLIKFGGLSTKKTQSLFGALRQLRRTFGSCTLDPAREWSDDRLATFLCTLPEISRKSAYCIMMYALDRTVFPVDTHVGRVLARLEAYRALDLDLGDLDHKKKQVVLATLVPPNLHYSLHVNLVAHGREFCKSQRPRCEECAIRKFCAFYRRRGKTMRVVQPAHRRKARS